MKTRKRILSFLLILTLIMTAMPTQAFAFTKCYPQCIPTFEKYVGERFETQFKVTSIWPGNYTGEIIFNNTGTETLENNRWRLVQYL